MKNNSATIRVKPSSRFFSEPVNAIVIRRPVPHELHSPYNLSHPDSKCSANNGKRHKFRELGHEKIRPGVRNVRSQCVACECWFNSAEDSTVLAGIFSLPG